MRPFLIYVFFIVVSFLSCKEQQQTSHSTPSDSSDIKFPHELLDPVDTSTIVFYNVENLFDTIDAPDRDDAAFLPSSEKQWNSKRYAKKLEKLSEVLASIDQKNPMLIGLAEIENRFVVHELLQTGKLNNTTYRVAHFESPDQRGIDVALAFDHKRFHVVHKEAIEVRIPEEPNFKTRDILYTKGVTKDSSILHVFVNHWSSRHGGQAESEYKRMRAAKMVKHKVDSIQSNNTGAAILIMGDFNDYPTNRSVKEVLQAGSSISESPLVNLLWEQHADGRGTHNYRGEWEALDQMIVSRPLLQEKGLYLLNHRANILDDDQFLYTKDDGTQTPNRTYGGPNYFGGYSDHLAIYTFLCTSSD
ncbi:MAG: hypothetical protein ACQERC_09585 [Bacteroidota bacterium]